MPTLLVRSLLVSAILLGPSALLAATPDAPEAFSFETVVDRARELAAKPYSEPAPKDATELHVADYDAYREIRFRTDKALWRGSSRFEVQFFHLGFLFLSPIEVNVVEDGAALPVRFDPAMFDYGKSGLDASGKSPSGFAGFRVHYPLHGPDYKDEVIVFLGASYFRVLGREQGYGLSARGLAIDTAMPKGEEFPSFRAFWLVKPGPNESRLTIYALLDGPRLTGAYQIELEPGTESRVHVNARVFARAELEKIGFAPFSSMHLFGENSSQAFDDFRPEVHDSDGLLIHSGSGRWLWRPLVNPQELQLSYFVERAPQGFGLFQRDRRFASYQDTEANYHRRPSYWIEPVGDWGEGGIELIEIPSSEEIHDNVVAYWRPKQRLGAGEERAFAYTLSATSRPPLDHALGRVVATRVGSARVPGTDDKPNPNQRRFVIDFAEGELPFLGPEQPVTADLVHSAGTVDDVTVTRVPDTGDWRVTFRVDLDDAETVELALTLFLRDAAVTETWLYRVPG